MFPVLLRFPMPWGDPDTYFPVRVFGLLLIVAFAVGGWIAVRRARRTGDEAPTAVFDLCFHLLAAGLVGARALYVLQHLDRFEGRWLQVVAIWEQGLVWWGAVLLGAAVLVAWSLLRRRSVAGTTDVLAPALAAALAIGWVGSFCSGDHHGIHVTDAAGEWVEDAESAPAWAVTYPGPDAGWRYEYSETPADFRAPYAVVPTQLLAAGAHTLLLVLLLCAGGTAWAEREGRLGGLFLVVHGGTLAALEPLRGDADRLTDVLGTPLTFTQAGAVPVVLLGAWWLLRRRTAPHRS